MKRAFLENGHRLIKRILDWIQLSKEETDKDRRNDYTDFGILSDVGDEFEIVEGDNNNPPITHSINVKTGLAYDSTGERVLIEGTLTPYDPAAPSATAPDGKGGTVSAPQSTGSQNITLTANVINYIWIDYLAILDTSEFTLQKVTNKKQYFKQEDGYQITVTTVDIAPTSASIKIGSVDLTGGGVVSPSTISQATRIYGGNKVRRTKIQLAQLNRSDATSSYVQGEEKFLDDHVKAVGTGVVSEVNPHGLAPLDIGFDPEASLEQHQQFLHSDGIDGDRSLPNSSLNLQHVPQTPGEDYVIIKPLLSTEIAHIN
jgi:hypothetical protein